MLTVFKVTSFSVMLVSFIGVFEYKGNLDSWLFALITLISALVWAWLISRLDSRYVKVDSCIRVHQESVNAAVKIEAALKARSEVVDCKFDKVNEKITLVGREVSELKGEVKEALKHL